MKRLLPVLVLSVAASSLYAEDRLPKELVGEWRFEDKTGTLVLVLRGDGLGGIMGSIGGGGIASYNPESREVTLSVRHERTGAEVTRMKWRFDPKAITLTQDKKKVSYQKHSGEVPEPFKSADLNKILNPKE